MSDNALLQSALSFMGQKCPQGLDYWLGRSGGIDVSEVGLQDHADIVYTLFLLNAAKLIDTGAAQQFSDFVCSASFYGRPLERAQRGESVGAHLTAYTLGATRLLVDEGIICPPENLTRGWDMSRLVDQRLLPLWPKQWSHHIWRVSHWIGGVPSILLQLSRYGHPDVTESFIHDVLESCEEEGLITSRGQLRPYRSSLLQQLFRSAYRVRHDPDLGALGGVVHLLWVYHAVGRPYPGRPQLHDDAVRHMDRRPFIESMPYCLDFDVVQLARTTVEGEASVRLVQRAREFYQDIADFLLGTLPHGYTLHKLPGALATMHECALICGWTETPLIEMQPVDIIKKAYWI